MATREKAMFFFNLREKKRAFYEAGSYFSFHNLSTKKLFHLIINNQ